MIRIKFFFCILGCLFSSSIFSQDTTFVARIRVPSFIDTLFIDHDLNNWSVRVFTNYKVNRFRLRNEDALINYAPHNPFGVGIGIGTRKVVLDLAFNIKDKSKEPTERFDMQATVMMKNHLLDYSLQTYHGFALNNEEITEFRPDISSLASRLAYLYLFNAKEYSMAAQKSGLSRQKQAAFSFGLGAFLFLNRIMADSSLVPSVLYPDFNEEARIVKLPGFGGGILANFSATVPFFKYFFASVNLIPGIGLIYNSVETDNESYHPDDPLLYQLDINAMLGFNVSRFYVNFSMGQGYNMTRLGFNNSIIYNTANAKFAVGYKIGKN